MYSREYEGRGVRPGRAADGSNRAGADAFGDSHPELVQWLGEVRELFPRETLERVERHALDRYGLIGLVNDPQVLAGLAPSQHLVRTLLLLKGQLSPQVLVVARRLIAQVIDELRRTLTMQLQPALAGRVNRHRHGQVQTAASFDARETIRRNLKNWDGERGRLVIAEPMFFAHNTRRTPWEIVVCVDQSGSMVDSVIHSAVMAAILAGLPAFRVKLVVFDHSVVDLTDRLDDPVEVLMTVQLGGGTNIGRAVRYCRSIIENPTKAVLVLITDFCEGPPVRALVREVKALAEDRVTLIGLAALDGDAHPSYDRDTAGLLAELGMHIAALTPAQLARWLVEVTT